MRPSLSLIAFAAGGFVCTAWAADSVADAAKRDDRAAVRSLISAHSDVNAPQVDGSTALHWVTYVDDVELARSLLDAGAKAGRVSTGTGMTVLALACHERRRNDGCQLLLESRSRPEPRSSWRWRPLC